MANYADEFKKILETENKQKAVDYALNLLKEEKLDVIRLYADVLSPALNEVYCLLTEKDVCMWKQHVRKAIVRTIVECCYPLVIKTSNDKEIKGTAVVLCPPEEHQDLEARMVTDYLTICGYNAVFVGSNTPFSDFYNAVDIIKPSLIMISVNSYYNLVVTKKIISDLRKKTSSKIMVSGFAFSNNLNNVAMVGADYFADSFDSIKSIIDEGV